MRSHVEQPARHLCHNGQDAEAPSDAANFQSQLDADKLLGMAALGIDAEWADDLLLGFNDSKFAGRQSGPFIRVRASSVASLKLMQKLQTRSKGHDCL